MALQSEAVTGEYRTVAKVIKGEHIEAGQTGDVDANREGEGLETSLNVSHHYVTIR